MVKKGNSRLCIVLTPDDQFKMDILKEKTGLKPTQLYRIALRLLYNQERKID